MQAKQLAAMGLISFASVSFADQNMATDNADQNDSSAQVQKESPWLATPTFSSDPKMGSSLGALVGYVTKFDSQSPSSMFGAMGSYSDTKSSIYGAFARTYFARDQHRLIAAYFGGNIENEYKDFLGTGLKAETTDDISGLFVRYTKRVKADWFIGVQATAMNYKIKGKNEITDRFLNLIGLTGFSGNGAGLAIERDTRDNQNSPAKGSQFSLRNTAYRKSLGGDEDFDNYTLNYAAFLSHGKNHVLAMRATGKWTQNAPKGAYSSVELRGYTRGEYLAPHATTLEIEERYALSPRWGLRAFAGAACLYGDGESCANDDNWFPSIGGGASFLLKPVEKMIVRAELASGKNNNYGFYIKFGNEF